jgi:hypothetical protein
MPTENTPKKTDARTEIFVREYLIDFNGTRAAIAAGYSERGAEVAASRLLRNPKAQKLIEKLTAERAKRLDIILRSPSRFRSTGVSGSAETGDSITTAPSAVAKLQIADSCKHLNRVIPTAPRDENNREEVAEFLGDDPLQGAGYGLYSIFGKPRQKPLEMRICRACGTDASARGAQPRSARLQRDPHGTFEGGTYRAREFGTCAHRGWQAGKKAHIPHAAESAIWRILTPVESGKVRGIWGHPLEVGPPRGLGGSVGLCEPMGFPFETMVTRV